MLCFCPVVDKAAFQPALEAVTALGDMLAWLLERYQKSDFYDLKDLLENHYRIVRTKEKLLTIIGGTELYCDTIIEAV